MCIKDEGFLEQCFILCHTLKLCAELKKLKEKEESGRGTARLQNPMVFFVSKQNLCCRSV